MATASIIQFRIELLDITPLIWRRIQVPDDYTFWDLHVAIQSAFAWNDSHLHEFTVSMKHGQTERFGIPMDADFGEAPALPGCEHRVAGHFSSRNPRVEYCYDFGDSWQHAVILEDIVPAAPGKNYPRCTAGERSGPPDDCGGPHGYESLLAILSNPEDEEYRSSHRWAASIKGVRGKFDPEAFDEQRVKFDDPKKRLGNLLNEM